MRRAPSPTVPRAHQAAQPPLPRAWRRALRSRLPSVSTAIHRSVRATDADAASRTFFAVSHAWFLLVYGLSPHTSLRQGYAAFASCRALVQHSGLARRDPADERLGVSFSQLAWANTHRPVAFWAKLATSLLAQVDPRDAHALPPDLHVLDATFLYLSSTLASWVTRRQRPHASGVKAHVRLTPASDLPTLCALTDSRLPDRYGLEDGILDDPAALAALRGDTLVFDLGYYSHPRVQRLRDARVHFVTRRHAQATLTVVEQLPVQQRLPLPDARLPPWAGGITVLRDERVVLGSPGNRASTCVANLRLVTARVLPRPAAARAGTLATVYEVLTDRFDLPAATVVAWYRLRWAVELFFKWLKCHLQLTHLLGRSPQAVLASLWLAVAVHALALLLARTLQRDTLSPALLAALYTSLLTLPAALLALPVAAQLPLPGFADRSPPT